MGITAPIASVQCKQTVPTDINRTSFQAASRKLGEKPWGCNEKMVTNFLLSPISSLTYVLHLLPVVFPWLWEFPYYAAGAKNRLESAAVPTHRQGRVKPLVDGNAIGLEEQKSPPAVVLTKHPHYLCC